MVDWQVTATTIYCDAAHEDVTIIVYGDWSTRCQRDYIKYGQNGSKETIRSQKKKSKIIGHVLGCEDTECARVIKYRDMLRAEEANKNRFKI